VVTPQVVTPQVVTPTSIMPASPGYPSRPAADPLHYPAVAEWRRLPRGNVYQTGGYPTVRGTSRLALPAGPSAGPAAPARSRPPVAVLLLGLLIGLLIFGSTGYLVGSTSGASDVDGASNGVGNTARESQEAANRRRVGPLLVPLAASWLPWLGGCLSSSEAGGPAPQAGEQSRVSCAASASINVFFVQYKATADRDKARGTRTSQNANSTKLAAGAAPVANNRSGTSKRTTGGYIEFAYQADGKTYGGIYWDDATSTAAAYIEKLWSDGDGGWSPLRDLWQRYS
jgi:hypothetical protein